jgi:hypothetical protein
MQSFLMLNLVGCRTYIIITTLAIIRRPVFCFKHVPENGFCLHLQVDHTKLCPIDRASLCLRRRLGQTEYDPPEDGDTIQSPICFVLN